MKVIREICDVSETISFINENVGTVNSFFKYAALIYIIKGIQASTAIHRWRWNQSIEQADRVITFQTSF